MSFAKKKALKIFLLLSLGGVLLLVLVYFITDHYQEPYILDDDVRDKVEGNFVTLSQGNVHYQFYGSETGELVVLVHGGGVAGCYVWSRTIPALIKAGYRVLCYDLYGRGYSDRPEIQYDPELLYHQFTELLDTLNIEDSFYLFGQSMGAMVATNFTAKNPDKVKKLVYIAPAILGGFTDAWYLKIPVISDMLMTFYWYPRSVNSQMEEFYDPAPMGKYKQQLEYFMKFKGYKSVNLSTWLNTYTISLEEQLQQIGKQNTDVLLILGRTDPYIPVQAKTLFEKAIPSLSAHIIEEAGHMPHYEKAKEVNKLIIGFLND